MSTVKLTEKIVARLKSPDPSGRQALHWDAEIKGFGVLCSGVSSNKTYVVQRAVNSKTRRITVGPANVLPLDAARRRAEEILSDFYKGIDPKASRKTKITLREALADYLKGNKTLRPRSAENYRDGVARHLGAWLDRPLTSISREMVMDRHAEIAAEVKATGRGNGHATANSTMRALRAVFNFAIDANADIGANPVARFKKRWFEVPRRERMVKADELPQFYRAILDLPNPIARDYILTLLFSGLRRREASGLRWSDVDFATKTIKIPAKRMKAKRTFDLPMCSFIHELMVSRRAMGKTEYVFPSNGKSRHIEEPKFAFDQIAKTTGIEVSAHDLRRTFVTTAVRAGVSGMTLKGLVAHAIGGDVTEGYSILDTEDLRELAEKVCVLMKKLCGVAEVMAPNIAKIR